MVATIVLTLTCHGKEYPTQKIDYSRSEFPADVQWFSCAGQRLGAIAYSTPAVMRAFRRTIRGCLSTDDFLPSKFAACVRDTFKPMYTTNLRDSRADAAALADIAADQQCAFLRPEHEKLFLCPPQSAVMRALEWAFEPEPGESIKVEYVGGAPAWEKVFDAAVRTANGAPVWFNDFFHTPPKPGEKVGGLRVGAAAHGSRLVVGTLEARATPDARDSYARTAQAVVPEEGGEPVPVSAVSNYWLSRMLHVCKASGFERVILLDYTCRCVGGGRGRKRRRRATRRRRRRV